VQNRRDITDDDLKARVAKKRKILADEYDIHSDEEFLEAFKKQEPIDITMFVTPLEELTSDEPVKPVYWPDKDYFNRW